MDVIGKGYVVMYKGKFWGIVYEDGHSRVKGWGDIKEADMISSKFDYNVQNPTDWTYPDSPDTEELKKGKVVLIERTTSYKVMEE